MFSEGANAQSPNIHTPSDSNNIDNDRQLLHSMPVKEMFTQAENTQDSIDVYACLGGMLKK